MTASIALLLIACASEGAEQNAEQNLHDWVYSIYPGVSVQFTAECRATPSALGDTSCELRWVETDQIDRFRCSTHPGGGCTLLADCDEEDT